MQTTMYDKLRKARLHYTVGLVELLQAIQCTRPFTLV